MSRFLRRLALISAVAVALTAGALPASAASDSSALTATLDGKPLALKEVGNWYCDDFAYPAIRCYSKPGSLESAVSPLLATSATDYIVVYDYATWGGSYMYMSQDYSALVTIGWNDRVSSYVALNSNSGHFYTDWFYGGTSYYFCCNSQVSYLGSFDNTFSSVHRG